MNTDTQTRGSVRSSDNHNQNHVEENGEERKGEPVEDEEKDHGELKDESVEIEHQGVHGPSQYPGPAQLAAVLLAAALSFFIVALDITIVSTAIPAITAEFHSLDDVAWYGSGFLVTTGVFQSVWGKAYKFFRMKPVYMTSVALFEIGSLVCAVAPTSTALIIGRAIAGVGAAGVTSGSNIIVALSVPPPRVPAVLGGMGVVFTIASAVGPLLGGAFTSHATWRWCFYINLPIGGLAALVILFFYRQSANAVTVSASLKEKLLQMDPVGAISLLVSVVCFVLALQWAGVSKQWSSGAVVAPLVVSAALLVVFIAVEMLLRDRALVPPRILRKKTMALLLALNVLVSGSYFTLLYYLPIYFQAVSGVDAAESGVRTIPLVGVGAIFSMVGGIFVSLTGEYQLVALLGTALVTIGGGLLYTLGVGTDSGRWIGYQVLVGAGIGSTLQLAIPVAQSVVEPEDFTTAAAMCLFFQFGGSSVFLAVGQSLFSNRLIEAVKAGSSIDAAAIVSAGATALHKTLSGQELRFAVQAYLSGLRDAYVFAIALGGLGFLVAVLTILVDRRTLARGISTAA